jgi:hypothetical protein
MLLPGRPLDVLHGPIAAITVASSSARMGKDEFGRRDRIGAKGKKDRDEERTLPLDVLLGWRI